MIHTDSYANNLGIISEIVSCTGCHASIEWNQGAGSRQEFRVKRESFNRRHQLCKRKRYVELNNCS